MRIHRIGLVAGLLLAAQMAGTGCILVPKIEKRNVLLVVSRIATVPLHATGVTNTFNGGSTVNLRDSVNIAQVVSDAGIDVANVEKVVVGKIEYRVAVADTTPGRAITNGHVTVSAGGRAVTDLIAGFSHSAGAVTPWLRADVSPGGVAELNQMLADVLAELKGGPAANETLGYSVSGNSAPSSNRTDFWYEIRMTILITGRVKTNVVN